ncbi:MAG: hypothetical protein ABIG84_03420 [archaeon]
MKKAMIILIVLLVFAVMVSGCASKKPVAPTSAPAAPETKPASAVSMPTNDIPTVIPQEGIAIDEPDLSAETDVDLGSLI